MADRAPNIHRSRVHEELVQRLSMQNVPGSERKLFPTIRELLCFAALLGFSEQRRVPLDRSQGVMLRNGGEYPDRALMALLSERNYLQQTESEPDLAAIKF
jgi:hypothetical protein